MSLTVNKMPLSFITPPPNSYLRNLAEFQESESEVNSPSSLTKKNWVQKGGIKTLNIVRAIFFFNDMSMTRQGLSQRGVEGGS